MLPFEEEVRQEVARDCAGELSLCRDVLQAGLDAVGCTGDGKLSIRPRRLNHGVGWEATCLSLGLYAKATKQFRSIMILGERGFVADATSLCRTLLECAQALTFLMQEVVTLKENGKAINPDPSRPFDTDFRAALYFACQAFEEERRLAGFEADGGPEAVPAWLGDPEEIRASAAKLAARIGLVWAKKLRDGVRGGRGFPGVSRKDLADTLGLLYAHRTIYGIQSSPVHAGDALDHFDLDSEREQGTLYLGPEPAVVGPTLHLAASIYLGCVIAMHNRLDLGVEERLNDLGRRFQSDDRPDKTP
jgi:hypothetical protein